MSNDEAIGKKGQPVWCIAANVLHERACGPGGLEKRKGTKHFAPGAKVHIVGIFWGSGWTDVTVVGRHRKSHRYITIAIQTKWLANWRVELVYSPRVIREIIKHGTYKPDKSWYEIWPFDENPDWASSPGAKTKAEDIIAGWSTEGGPASKIQAPVTRTREKGKT